MERLSTSGPRLFISDPLLVFGILPHSPFYASLSAVSLGLAASDQISFNLSLNKRGRIRVTFIAQFVRVSNRNYYYYHYYFYHQHHYHRHCYYYYYWHCC